MDYQELVNVLKDGFPDKVIDIIESLELLKMVINDTIEVVGKKINISFSEKQYDKIPYYSEIAKGVGDYEKKIEEIITMLDIEDIELEETYEEIEEKTIPNYDEYTVDHNVEYTLYENFTHKRPHGFKLSNNPIAEVKTWQDMLIKTCEYLITVDEKKIMGFENIKSMNGKKNKYFSVKSKGMRNPKMVANKIYIETNQSGNAIRNLLIKLLKEYGFSINEFKVYLRADYTTLNEK